jgi:REP element-mobilizing transposase RayT
MSYPQRKNNRLKNYDYSQSGYYFITICTYNKYNIFGRIMDGTMVLNKNGSIVKFHIDRLSSLYKDINIDKYIIMPNHLHMIIIIKGRERISCVPQKEIESSKMLLPKIIQSFKSSITKDYKKEIKNGTHTMRSLQIWQKSFHDHVIRNYIEYQEIWKYIDENPLKWELDKYYKQ